MKIGGKTIDNKYLIGGGALLVGGYIYWKKQASASAAANTAASSSTSATAIDPLTGLPYSEDSTIDPMTGMTYLQEAQQYGSVSAAEAALSSGASGYGGYGGYSAYYPSSSSAPSPSSPAGYTTNAQWAQAVTAGLVSLGYTATDIASALGLYFQAHPLDSTQAGIVQAAVAEYGPPPVGTFQIITTPGSPPPPGGGNLTVHASARSTNVTGTWGAVSGATSYNVVVTTGKGSQQVASATVTGTSYTAGHLQEKTSYAIHVTAEPGGQTGVGYTSTQ